MARPQQKTRNLGPVNQAIVELRKTLGMSQQSFAVSLGVALNTVARWEAGMEPSGASLIELHRLAAHHEHKALSETFWDAAAAEVGKVGIWRIGDIYTLASEALAALDDGDRSPEARSLEVKNKLQQIQETCGQLNPALRWHGTVTGAVVKSVVFDRSPFADVPQSPAPKAKGKRKQA